MTLRHSSTSVSQVVALAPAMPALLMRMSMRPRARMLAWCAAATAAGWATSQAIAVTSPPRVSAFLLASAVSRSQMAMRAPEHRKRSLIALPKPWAPPVTTALQPLRSMLLLAIRALLFLSVMAIRVVVCFRVIVGSTGKRSPSRLAPALQHWHSPARGKPGRRYQGIDRQPRSIKLLVASGGGMGLGASVAGLARAPGGHGGGDQAGL